MFCVYFLICECVLSCFCVCGIELENTENFTCHKIQMWFNTFLFPSSYIQYAVSLYISRVTNLIASACFFPASDDYQGRPCSSPKGGVHLTLGVASKFLAVTNLLTHMKGLHARQVLGSHSLCSLQCSIPQNYVQYQRSMPVQRVVCTFCSKGDSYGVEVRMMDGQIGLCRWTDLQLTSPSY